MGSREPAVGDRELERLLRIRAEAKRRKPEFTRMNAWMLARLGDKWRRPKGLDNKIGHEIKGYPAKVKVGYGSPRLARGRHPSGYAEVLVHNPRELEGLDPALHAIRIAHTVGRRKRIEILKKAEELGLKVLNA